MKKTLILLSLIYFISCKISCEQRDNIPENKEDCYNRAVVNENGVVCCYIKVKTPVSVSACVEIQDSLNKEFMKKVLVSQYSGLNYTLEDFSCPTKEKKDDTPNTQCDYKDPKESKDCFSSTLIDEKNNHCCYMKVTIDGTSQGLCREISKELSASDIKQNVIEQITAWKGQIDEIQCPS